MRREANPGRPGLTGAGGPQSKHPHSYNVDKYNFYYVDKYNFYDVDKYNFYNVDKYNFYNVDKYNFYDVDKYSFYDVISVTFEVHHVGILTFTVAMMFTRIAM